MCCFCVQKKSREESRGADSGVEILVNEPYTGGPGGSGQYTRKIYHVGSHLPGAYTDYFNYNTGFLRIVTEKN